MDPGLDTCSVIEWLHGIRRPSPRRFRHSFPSPRSGLCLALILIILPQACGPPRVTGEDAVLAAYEAGRSDLWVEVEGRVERLLADDTRGSRHQRFILRLSSGHTLLISHNIDLAPRVPLERGQAVRVRGEYEWNERGGVVHWTHHDPQNRHPGGYVWTEGEAYR